MAAQAYCIDYMTGVHVHARYREIKQRYASRLRALQHRYQDSGGIWRGGYTVSDPLGQKHGGHLFHSTCGPCTP